MKRFVLHSLFCLAALPAGAGTPVIRDLASAAGNFWDDSPDIAITDVLPPDYNGLPRTIFQAIPSAADWQELPALENAWERHNRDPLESRYHFVLVRVCNPAPTATQPGSSLMLRWTRNATELGDADFACDGFCLNGVATGGAITEPRPDARRMSATSWSAFAAAWQTLMHPQSGLKWEQNEPGFGGVPLLDSLETLTAATPPSGLPHSVLFLPWAREYLNRMEALLRVVDPCVRLPFWDWRGNPEAAPAVGVDPLLGAQDSRLGVRLGAVTGGSGFDLAAWDIVRGGCHSPAVFPADLFTVQEESILLSSPDYLTLCNQLDVHLNRVFRVLGGDTNAYAKAVRDPLFVLALAGADRLWARWQRFHPQDAPWRLVPFLTFDKLHAAPQMEEHGLAWPLAPWHSLSGLWPDRCSRSRGASFLESPYEIQDKLPFAPAVALPPVYEGAPVLIPVLQPYQTVVLAIPFLAPRDCHPLFGDNCTPAAPTDCHPPEWFCFEAEISDVFTPDDALPSSWQPPVSGGSVSVSTPFAKKARSNRRRNGTGGLESDSTQLPLTQSGMAPPAGPTGVFFSPVNSGIEARSELVRNTRPGPADLTLVCQETAVAAGDPLFTPQRFIEVRLHPALWGFLNVGASSGLVNVQPGQLTFEIRGPAVLRFQNVPPGISGWLHTRLVRQENDPGRRVYRWTVAQSYTGAAGPFDGGQHYEFDLRAVTLVPRDSGQWKYFDTGTPPPAWTQAGFADATWSVGSVPFDTSGAAPATPLSPLGQAWYFRHAFTLTNPAAVDTMTLRIQANDGFVAWVNGTVVATGNLPSGSPQPGSTSPYLSGSVLPSVELTKEDACQTKSYTFKVADLTTGTNVLTVLTSSGKPEPPRRSGLKNVSLTYALAQAESPRMFPNAVKQADPFPVRFAAPLQSVAFSALAPSAANSGWTPGTSLSISLDGQPLTTASIASSGLATWNVSAPALPPGLACRIHRITASVIESRPGRVSRAIAQADAFLIVQDPAAPRVSLVSPASEAILTDAAPVLVSAELSLATPGWSGAGFTLWRSDLIGSTPLTLPWNASATLPFGAWSLTARAASTLSHAQSAPRLIRVSPDAPFSFIDAPGGGTVLQWAHPDACLEFSTDLESWQLLPSAVSPWPFNPGASRRLFYRLRTE